MGRRRAIFAVRPALAQALVIGKKRVEFRRARPNLKPGDIIYVYATSPMQAIIGRFLCGNVIEDATGRLWRDYGEVSEVTKSFFSDYFNGSPKGFAIEVRDPRAWLSPVTLESIKALYPGFHPPRSYRILSDEFDLVQLLRSRSRNGRGGAGDGG